jgi:hypothetical protein
MMRKNITSTFLWGFIVMLLLTACSAAGETTSQNIPPQSIPTYTPSLSLATPYAQEPAAGICASFDGEYVTVTLNVDIPSPRCTRIRADQKLSVVNNTMSTLGVSIASFSHSLLPGETYSIDVPFGDYLAAGVHQLSVTPCCGAELWLEPSQ